MTFSDVTKITIQLFMQNDVASALTNCNNKIEEINKKLDTQSSAQKILPPSFTGSKQAMNKRVTQNSLKH